MNSAAKKYFSLSVKAAILILAFAFIFYKLNDNRNLVGRWDQALTWIEQVWLPYAVKSGLKKFAHVTHTDALATGAASVMQDLVKDYIEMQVFSDLESAKDWLRDHNN